MKLYFKPGACSLASHIVLNELKETFDLEKVDTTHGTTDTGTDFLTVNPNGYVPALQLDSGEVITENSAILQYLADRSPESGLAAPAGTMERVRVQELLSFLSSELHKAFSPFFSGTDLSEQQRCEVEHQVERRIHSLELLLHDSRQYLMGDRFSVADAYAFAILNWTNFIDFDLSLWPLTRAFVHRVGARQSTVKAMMAEGLVDGEEAQ